MAFIFCNMLKLFLISLFCLSVHCEEETYDDLSQWLNDPKFLYELQKRLGISEPSNEPETGCFDSTGRFARPGDSECNFRAKSSKIIKTTESLSQGAKYLKEFANISCPSDCSKLCCEDQECDTAVYRNKDDHNCYLFQCGVDSRCVFVHHSDYWMSSISTTVHASHSFSSGAGTISHENELENLGTSSTEPPKPTPKATQPPTQPPTTTTSTTTTAPAPGLGEYCASYETECEDPHAECLMKSCQCRVGYHAKHRVCRKRCQVDEFECDNVAYGPSMRDCIPGVYRCNGRSECVDGSDEENCPSQQQIPAYQDEDDLTGNNIYGNPSLTAQYPNTKDSQFPYGFPMPGPPKNQQQASANQIFPVQIPANQNIGGQYYVPGLANQNVGLGLPQTGNQIGSQWPFLNKNAGLGAPVYPGPIQYPTNQQGYIPGQNGYIPYLQNPVIPAQQPVNQNNQAASQQNPATGQRIPLQQNETPKKNVVKPTVSSDQGVTQPPPVTAVSKLAAVTPSPEKQYKLDDKPVETDNGDPDAFDNRFLSFPNQFDQEPYRSSKKRPQNYDDNIKAATQEYSDSSATNSESSDNKIQAGHAEEETYGRNSAELDESSKTKLRTYPPSTKSKLQIGSPTQSTVPGQKIGQGASKPSEDLIDYPWMGLSYDSDSPRISGKKGRPSSGADRVTDRKQSKTPDMAEENRKTPGSKYDTDKVKIDTVDSKYDAADTVYDNTNGAFPDRVNPSGRFDPYRRPSNNRRPSYDRFNDRYPDSRSRPSGHAGSRYPAYYDQGYQPTRGRHTFPVWDQLKDEYYYPDEFESRRLPPSSDVEYEEYRPDVVNSDNTPFVDKPAEASGGVKKPSPDTGSSSDGFQSSGSKSGGSQSKPADTERVPDKEPDREPVNQGQEQEADKVKIQVAMQKTTPAPIKTKVPVTTKAPVPDTPSATPDSHVASEESKDQASTNVDSSGSSKEETQSKISDQTDDQSTESKTSNRTGAIEVLFMDKNTVVESLSDNNQGPIVALALGLGITLVMLIFVGCRLRNVKRRLRKGRALHSNEADYLINGMYL